MHRTDRMIVRPDEGAASVLRDQGFVESSVFQVDALECVALDWSDAVVTGLLELGVFRPRVVAWIELTSTWLVGQPTSRHFH